MNDNDPRLATIETRLAQFDLRITKLETRLKVIEGTVALMLSNREATAELVTTQNGTKADKPGKATEEVDTHPIMKRNARRQQAPNRPMTVWMDD